MVQNVDPILKALTDGFVGAGMGANTHASGMSSFDTSGNELVGESSVFSPKVLEDFVATHG